VQNEWSSHDDKKNLGIRIILHIMKNFYELSFPSIFNFFDLYLWANCGFSATKTAENRAKLPSNIYSKFRHQYGQQNLFCAKSEQIGAEGAPIEDSPEHIWPMHRICGQWTQDNHAQGGHEQAGHANQHDSDGILFGCW
jgi:hypothetical protein